MQLTIQDAMLFSLLLAAFYTDIKDMRIPNRLTFGGAGAGLVYHMAVGGWNGLTWSGLGLIAGFGLLLLLYFIGALGAGDVKLFASIGAISGLPFVLHCLMYSIIYAGLIGLAILLVKKSWKNQASSFFCELWVHFLLRRLDYLARFKERANLRFPFMYAVLPAGITTWINMTG